MLCDLCKESIPDGCNYYFTDLVIGLEGSRFCCRECLMDAVDEVVEDSIEVRQRSVSDEMADAEYTAMKEGV